MRIAQVTDIHIGHAGELHHGIDARSQFVQVLDDVRAQDVDHMVISGDLCFREAADDTYTWIAGQLGEFPFPVTIMAGNHDDQRVMQRHLPTTYHAGSNEIYLSTRLNGVSVLFLDTARGTMSDTQSAWMREALDGSIGPVILFMHHPPLYCGVPHMDEKYAYQQIPEIQQILRGVPSHLHIFCGHYHVERHIAIANQDIFLTPSTFFQIDATRVEFGIDHSRPGYRIIEVADDGSIRTTCRYL